jgi:hypothetical protein
MNMSSFCRLGIKHKSFLNHTSRQLLSKNKNKQQSLLKSTLSSQKTFKSTTATSNLFKKNNKAPQLFMMNKMKSISRVPPIKLNTTAKTKAKSTVPKNNNHKHYGGAKLKSLKIDPQKINTFWSTRSQAKTNQQLKLLETKNRMLALRQQNTQMTESVVLNNPLNGTDVKQVISEKVLETSLSNEAMKMAETLHESVEHVLAQKQQIHHPVPTQYHHNPSTLQSESNKQFT